MPSGGSALSGRSGTAWNGHPFERAFRVPLARPEVRGLSTPGDGDERMAPIFEVEHEFAGARRRDAERSNPPQAVGIARGGGEKRFAYRSVRPEPLQSPLRAD